MALFSEDLRKFQELEKQYRTQLTEYQAEAAAYNALLKHDPKNPDLPQHYAEVEKKGEVAQKTYAGLEAMRRARLSSSAA